MEVEIREEASSAEDPALMVNNTPTYPALDGPVVIIRVEEVLLVALVLVIWVAAIALFFNRWGKIRMLEPYQPKFHQQPHRPSCPLAPLSPPGATNQARMSFSKYNVNALTDPLSALPSPIIRRPRQNSVFVGSSTVAMLNPPPRRVKSAMDIHHLLVNEASPAISLAGSVIPILNRDRRHSLLTIDKQPPPSHYRHRPSITIDRPLLSHHHRRTRRSSCFVDKHRNFASFERPTISLETPLESMENVSRCTGARPKTSRSFEHAREKRAKPERMANSLDVSSLTSSSFDRRCSIPEEDVVVKDGSSTVFITLDETRITAPLLESLKSSDV